LTDYYTNVEVYGGKVLFRGIENGRRVNRKISYAPSLFVPSSTPSKYKTIYGENLQKIEPGSIKDCRDFVSQYQGVEGFKIYGNQRYQYAFISDHFKEDIHWDISDLVIANIDIEVFSEDGFPEPEASSFPVTAITVKIGDTFYAFGCKPYNNYRDDVTYTLCRDEADLLKCFIDRWSINYPDIVTGWNVDAFDITYLINRITKILGETYARKMSPWNVLRNKTINVGNNRKVQGYTILGVATLDLLDLYKRYAPNGVSQESHKLDNIAHVELGERKVSFAEYGTLHKLYTEDYQKFMDYNIKDTDLVGKINDKHKLVELAITLSYDNKCNFEDVFAQVRMWDVICFNHLRERDLVVPPREEKEKNERYVGAYVKDPLIGFHNWVASFDVTSEYPKIIEGSNISPETLVEPEDYDDYMRTLVSVSVDNLLSKSVDTTGLTERNLSFTANGHFYRRDKMGFMPELVQKMFNQRKEYKTAQIEAEKQLELETDPSKKIILKNKISKFKNLQMAKKVSLNSLYGAMGSQYFRFFDIRNAIAVTLTGQLTIRWIENTLNAYLNKLLKTNGEDYVIAVDTDSVYLNLDRMVCESIGRENSIAKVTRFLDKACEAGLQPVIDRACESLGRYLNVHHQTIQLKREVIADKAIWTAKKRYILNVHNSEGVQYAKPKKKIMGLELRKSSTPAFCRDKLSTAVDIIFDKDEKSVQDFIKEVREDFGKQPLSEISFPRGVNGLVKYANDKTIYGSGTPIHVRGALVYNNLISSKGLDHEYPLIQNGEKLKFIYLKEPNPIHSNVISFPQGDIPEELDLSGFIDYNLQFTKAFLEPLKIILDSIKWKTEKTSSLEDFWS
jgi:DNA polymerase elongation subunit (family B)